MKLPSKKDIQKRVESSIETPSFDLIGEDKEDKMTPAQEKKREKIVLSMKKDEDDFKKRYGKDWKRVMYATATKMAMKKEENALDEAGELQGDTTFIEFTTVQDAMDYAAALHKANIKHRKSGLKVEVVDASGEAMSLAKKYNGRPVFEEEAPAVNTSGISGMDSETVGVHPKHMGKTGDIQRRQEKPVKEGLETSMRFHKHQMDKKMIDELEGHPVFKVSSDEFNSFRQSPRRRNARWSKSFKEDSKIGSAIKKYSLRNPRKPVVIQDEETGDIAYLRRRNNDRRLRHNRKGKENA